MSRRTLRWWRPRAAAATLSASLALIMSAAAPAQEAASSDHIGISVSEPKVYEEATLRSMLEVAEARLRALAFIDAAPVASAVGRLSGGRADTTALSLTASPIPLPAETISLERTPGTSDELVDSKETIQRQQAAVSVTPSAPSATSTALPTASFGLSARDLLAEQMALSYQVMNLRLALERAASDRLNSVPDSAGATQAIPRKAIVLGFNVSVERPRKKAIAEIELELDLCTPRSAAITKPADDLGACEPLDQRLSEGQRPPRVSIVMLLPTKDSYNVVNITKSSQNLAGGQITSVFTVAGGFFKGSETYYIARDIDTIASVLPPDPDRPNRLRMRWQFRPVLGRPTVEAGPRQVFAMLAIDDDQELIERIELRTAATARWIRTGRRGVLGKTLVQTASVPLRTIGYWGLFNRAEPTIWKPDWIALSPTQALLTIDGALFSPDSRLLLGDRVIDRTTGLELSEESKIAAIVPLLELARAADIYLINRFLAPTPVRYLRDEAQATVAPKLSAICTLEGASGAEAVVHIQVHRQPIWGKDASLANTPKLVVVAKDRVYLPKSAQTPSGVLSFALLADTPSCQATSGCELLEVTLPIDVLRDRSPLRVRELLAGQDRDSFCQVEAPNLFFVESATILSRTAVDVVVAFSGRLPASMEVLVNGHWKRVPDSQLTNGLAYLTLPWATVVGLERLLVRSTEPSAFPPQLVSIERLQAPKPRFQFEKLTAPQGSTGPANLRGLQLDSIVDVIWDGAPLEVRKRSAEELVVIIPARLTSHAGVKRLELKLVDGQSEWYPVEVVAPKT